MSVAELFWRHRVEYTVAPSADGSFMVVKARGEVTRRTAMQMNLEAHALGKKLKIDCYLVDVTEARNVDTVAENYEFAYSDMEYVDGIDKYAIVAIVPAPDDHSHDFVETVSRNAGLNVTMFRDLNEAKQFLVGLPPLDRPDLDEDEGGSGSKRTFPWSMRGGNL